jgi:hypothetical protein
MDIEEERVTTSGYYDEMAKECTSEQTNDTGLHRHSAGEDPRDSRRDGKTDKRLKLLMRKRPADR